MFFATFVRPTRQPAASSFFGIGFEQIARDRARKREPITGCGHVRSPGGGGVPSKERESARENYEYVHPFRSGVCAVERRV